MGKNVTIFIISTWKRGMVLRQSDSVLQAIKEMIYNDYKMGDKIPTEAELEKMLGVGRSTIRENLKVLSAMGLIERRNKGTFITENTRGCLIEPFNMIVSLRKDNFQYLQELREILEVNIIVLAMERITTEDIRVLERLHWKMQNPDFTSEYFLQHDADFHNAIARATGNDILIELLSAVRWVIMENMKKASMDPAIQRITIQEHRNIIDALKERNLADGLNYMKTHLKTSQKIHVHVSEQEHAIEFAEAKKTNVIPSIFPLALVKTTES